MEHPDPGVDVGHLRAEGVAIIAIFPMVFAKGVGGEILAPMALPVLGGLLISDEVVDIFLPVRFYWVRRARWLKLHAAGKALKEQHEITDEERRAASPRVGRQGATDPRSAGSCVAARGDQ